MKTILYFTLLISGIIQAQSADQDLSSVIKKFKSFEYRAVIESADSLLARGGNIDTTIRIELLRMKGIAHYTLKERELSHDSFLEILQMNRDYTLEPFTTPPKIIEFYNIIKKSYNLNRIDIASQSKKPLASVSYTPNITGVLARSVLFPGWGHTIIDQKTKGRWIMAATLLTLPPLAYCFWDSHNKEQDYLNEIDRSKIESRYNEYNNSFKLRNVLIITYTTVWLYSQIDVLSHYNKNPENPSFSIITNSYSNDGIGIGILLHF